MLKINDYKLLNHDLNLLVLKGESKKKRINNSY